MMIIHKAWLLHNQWNGGLNEHRSGSLPKKTLQTNGRTNMNIKSTKYEKLVTINVVHCCTLSLCYLGAEMIITEPKYQ